MNGPDTTHRILAKSDGESLTEHVGHCVRAARALLRQIPRLPGDPTQYQNLARDVLDAVLLHDVGKAAAGFQRYLRNETSGWHRRHEILSASFASTIPYVSDYSLFAILTHHQALPPHGLGDDAGCLPEEQLPWPDSVTPVWGEMAAEWLLGGQAFVREWRAICRHHRRSWEAYGGCRELPPLRLDRAWLRNGMGRGTQLRCMSNQARFKASLVLGLTMASDHLGSAHRVPPRIPRLSSFRVLAVPARPFQQRCGTTDGSAILRAPTGSGKTEAALLWAQYNQQDNGRLFYVLPYTASINAMYRRLGPGTPPKTGLFGADNVGVVHSRAAAALYAMQSADIPKHSRQQVARAQASLAREMWFPIRVCTPHQIMRFTLRGRGWESMLAEFPGACFIFDEIHAYDPRMVGLTLASARLVSKWGGRCLFLSATLPKFLESLIQDALTGSERSLPVLQPDRSKLGDREVMDRKRHHLSVARGSLLDQIPHIVAAAQNGSTLVVCNHVSTARMLYDALKGSFPDGQVCLLHSLFNAADRNRIEQLLIDGQGLPRILVSTQVVEVSLNVDFDTGFLEPAPIDASVQRFGRVHRDRQPNESPGAVTVVREQINSHRLYDPALVAKTIEILGTLSNPLSETDLVAAADKVYGDGYRGEQLRAFNEGLQHPDLQAIEDAIVAGTHREWLDQLMERVDGIVELLPRCLEADYRELRKQGLWIEADSLLVPVRLALVRGGGGSDRRINRGTNPWIVDAPYTSDRGLEL